MTDLLKPLRTTWDTDERPNWELAELLATVSLLSYSSPGETETPFRTLGFQKIIPVQSGSQFGYVLAADDVTVVAFRGTDDREDWRVNLSTFRPYRTDHGKVHSGFYRAYQPLQSKVNPELKTLSPNHLWITGHSLGGALAVISAYDLGQRHDISGVITFGQPMVARQRLAEYLDSLLARRYVRFVNGDDIVPRIPPRYTHCGVRVWFRGEDIVYPSAIQGLVGDAVAKSTAQVEIDEPPPLTEREFEEWQLSLRAEMETTDDRTAGPLLVKGNIPLLRDHAMEIYLAKVREQANKMADR